MLWATACFLALSANLPVAVMVDKPVTIDLAVPEQLRHSKNVLLRLEGVVMRRDAPAKWNVFWDMPEANAQTSVDNVHFVGYIASPANSAVRDAKPANFTLQLPSAAELAIHRQTTIHFTFVPTRKLPEGGVTIASARLE
jgi:hypothetical protein